MNCDTFFGAELFWSIPFLIEFDHKGKSGKKR